MDVELVDGQTEEYTKEANALIFKEFKSTKSPRHGALRTTIITLMVTFEKSMCLFPIPLLLLKMG
jgi:hypothetical protein